MIFLFFFFFVVLSATRRRPPHGRTKDRRESCNLTCLLAKSCSDVTTRTMLWICKIYFLFVLFVFIRFECFCPKAVETLIYADNVMDMYIVFFRSIHFYSR